MKTWKPFYDPDFYELEVGSGGRVGEAYRALLAGAPTKCLELGCGTGEVLIKLAEQGHQVTGLDASEAMLERARLCVSDLPAEQRARIRLISGDMASFALDESFTNILLTNEAVLHVLEGAALKDLCACCHRHLSQGGVIWLDLPRIDFEKLAGAANPYQCILNGRGVYPFDREGRSVQVTEQYRFDVNTWRLTTYFTYQFISPDGVLESTVFRELQQRPWTVQEMRFALELAGFSAVQEVEVPNYRDRWFLRARRR